MGASKLLEDVLQNTNCSIFLERKFIAIVIALVLFYKSSMSPFTSFSRFMKLISID